MIGKFVIYTRVSTVGQAEDGFGLEIQEATIRARINADLDKSWQERTHKEVRVHRDKGVSGALVDRPGLSGALRSLEKGDVLIVAKLDRLARDLISQELLLREVRSKGARLWSCAPGEQPYIDDDPDDPSRKFIRQILGATAEYEKAMITMRLRGGRKAKRDKGGYAGGEPPFGFRVHELGGLTEDLREQDVLAMIRKLRSQGLSFEAIGRVLNATEGMQPRRGDRGWRRDNVHRVSKPRRVPVLDDEIRSA